VVASQATKEV